MGNSQFGSLLLNIPQKLNSSDKSNNLMCGMTESEGLEGWKCETSDRLSLTVEKKTLYYKESGQQAKVDAVFANTAHMETARLTSDNLTFGLRPKQHLSEL